MRFDARAWLVLIFGGGCSGSSSFIRYVSIALFLTGLLVVGVRLLGSAKTAAFGPARKRRHLLLAVLSAVLFLNFSATACT